MPELKTSVRKPRRQRREMAQQDWTLGLEVVHPRAAGIDVGAGEPYVAVPPHCDPEGKAVRSFQTFTTDLNRLADWLQRCGITTVAMQSTGVYWIPLYDVLERRGIEVFVVNARHTRNLPGRTSDVQECEWLLQLHGYGLLRNSFRPAEQIRILYGPCAGPDHLPNAQIRPELRRLRRPVLRTEAPGATIEGPHPPGRPSGHATGPASSQGLSRSRPAPANPLTLGYWRACGGTLWVGASAHGRSAN